MAAAKTKRAAARAKKTITFHGLKLEVPTKLPSSLFFDIADLEEAKGSGARESKALLTKVYGSDQFAKIRETIEKKVEAPDVLDEVLKLITRTIEAAGADAGK